MSEFILTRREIRNGVYRGVLKPNGRTRSEPVLELRLLDTSLGALTISPSKDGAKSWDVVANIPADAINEGVRTFVIRDAKSAETLDSFALIAGVALDGDLRAEIALLRAELDLLKQAFRLHCAKTPA
ncbi:MAG: hypothetical protein GXP05_04615 [Alphaproteobacteria bacterium]|nr:hypothetical protein [Alphaproteobacteria bacterium]